MFKFGIEKTQPSTVRGIIWLGSGIIALVFLIFDGVDKAMAIMAIAGTLSGAVGTFIIDPPPSIKNFD